MKLPLPRLGEADIAAMLAMIPPRPDYEIWMRVASAVFAETSAEAGCRLLNAWSPEERTGEYMDKWRHRLKNVGIGTLVHMAKDHGYSPRRSAPTSLPVRKIRRRTDWITGPTATATATATAKRETEPERIASELQKLHAAGWIEDDTDARFYAKAIHLFKARFDG